MVRPHDLLFPRGPDAFRSAGPRPGWLDAQAPLVVRREATVPGIAAVGARGLHRNERCKGHLALADVADIVTPRMLTQRRSAPTSDSMRSPASSAVGSGAMTGTHRCCTRLSYTKNAAARRPIVKSQSGQRWRSVQKKWMPLRKPR